LRILKREAPWSFKFLQFNEVNKLIGLMLKGSSLVSLLKPISRLGKFGFNTLKWLGRWVQLVIAYLVIESLLQEKKIVWVFISNKKGPAWVLKYLGLFFFVGWVLESKVIESVLRALVGCESIYVKQRGLEKGE